MADSSTELIVNIIVIFLVLLSYVVPFLLRSLRKKREQRPRGQEPGPVETIEKTFTSLETVLSGEVAEDEKAPAEALSIDAEARAALRDAAALAEQIRELPHLAALAPLVEREIVGPLEKVRRTAAVLLKNPEAQREDAFFSLSGRATVMDRNYLIYAVREIISSWRSLSPARRALPTVHIAEAFFKRLGAALSDLYPDVDRFVPVAVPASLYGSMIQDEKLSAAGLILYPASTEPADSPMDYSVPVFYLAANVAGALVSSEALEAAGLSPQTRPTLVILAGHYMACSLLGPSYIDAMRSVKRELFTDEELEACRRALADQPMSLSRGEGTAQEFAVSESAAQWGEALVSLPLFGSLGLSALADRSPLRFDRSAIDAVSDALVANVDEITEKNPFVLLAGAMTAAARYPEAAVRLARTLEALLRGERPVTRKPRTRAAPEAVTAADAALTSDEVVAAVVLGAFFTPPRPRRGHGRSRPPVV